MDITSILGTASDSEISSEIEKIKRGFGDSIVMFTELLQFKTLNLSKPVTIFNSHNLYVIYISFFFY